mmetsp:Transcript_23169/g.37158  ORF Transcript_23169/g.37158 Transcript_23169/m.37158 type:complete len:369 (+) Transcript_23169:72-1178(+)|eukprot:CAMPEP_0179464576 /NCGR_PEP_ID=MMETSP0799-20121207/46361_1 /TAXON_ID=46947 /ORGANISM="Geminigera cryophila, Strain CCMP2564" /LENGTH=368 /DNA_ID=CAMNT_0021268435 /DNA_START=71 /DNA_END=1177 /DNA_ORIENTATION=-
MRTSVILSLVLACATAANGNLAMPFPFGGPQMSSPTPSSLRNQPLLRGRDAIVERFEMAKAKAAKVVTEKLDLSKYPKLFAAGGLCASITHLVTVPLDVVKTRMQVTPGVYTGINDGISKIYAAEGFKGCMQGATPTFIGFLMQGALKYGFYEFFKDSFAQQSGGKEGSKLPVPQMMLAASAAEILGTSCLLPFESIRIRMVADPSFATGTVAVGKKLFQEQGIKGLYGGMVPILCKQIPFTITQFLMYEFAAKAIYKKLAASGVEDANARFGTLITLGCGLISGTAAALVSQPGDTVLSTMNKQSGISVMGALKQLGPKGLYLGAGARCVHVTSYIVAQFLIYDSIKRVCGIPVAGAQIAPTTKSKK